MSGWIYRSLFWDIQQHCDTHWQLKHSVTMRRRSGDWRYQRLDPIAELPREMQNCSKWFLAILLVTFLLFICFVAYSVGYNGTEGTVSAGGPGQHGGSIGQNRTGGERKNFTAGQEDELGKQVIGSEDKSQSSTQVMGSDDNTQTSTQVPVSDEVSETAKHVLGAEDQSQNSTQISLISTQVLGSDEESQTSKTVLGTDDHSQNNTQISLNSIEVPVSEDTLKKTTEENQETYDLDNTHLSTQRSGTFETESNIPDDNGSKDDQESVSAKENSPRRPHISREMVQAKIDQAVANIRNGKGDKLHWQFLLQLLQHILKKMDKAKAREDHEDDEDYDVNSEEEKLIALENPRITHTLETLNDSPKELDKYDFTKPLVWDFPCLFLKLGLKPEPAICINSRHNDVLVPSILFQSGNWEKLMLNYFIEIVKFDSRLQVVDLGSSLGMFSLSAAALGRPVLAVECSVRNILPFHKSVIMNHFQKYVTLVTNCLSNTYKLVELIYSPHGHFGDATTVDITKSMLKTDEMDPKDVVRTVTLNDLLPALIHKTAVLKIDLQGDEASVFRAASHFFHVVQVRYALIHWRYTSNPKDYEFIFDFLKKRNYVPYHSPHGKAVSDRDMKKNQPVIVWMKF